MALKEEMEKQGNWLFRYRSFLPLAVLLTGLIVFIDTNLSRTLMDICTYNFEFLCLFVSFIGIAIRIYTVGYTPKNTSGRNTVDGQIAETLNTTGIYSVVRHPLYLGNFFMWLGLAVYTENFWFVMAFIMFYWVYYERIMYAEEQFLERKFGQVYTDWATITPAFIPKISLFKRPNITFSFKKVLKKEKNGVFAVFLIFFVFDLIGEQINYHSHFNLFFAIGTVITALLYIILKVLKSRTDLLNESV